MNCPLPFIQIQIQDFYPNGGVILQEGCQTGPFGVGVIADILTLGKLQEMFLGILEIREFLFSEFY